MTRPATATLGPFGRGYCSAIDPTRLPAGLAVEALDCEIDQGVLEGSWGPGTAGRPSRR